MAGPADGRRRRGCGGWPHRGDGGHDAASMSVQEPGHGTDDTADHRGWLSIDRAVTRRDGTGRGRRLILLWRWPGAGAGRSGSHGPAAPIAFSGPGRPPLWSARAGLLDPVARNRIRFSRSPSFPVDRCRTSPAGKLPLTAGSTGTYAEFVIAIAGLDHCCCSALTRPACLIGSNVAKYSIRNR
jgi:hypothetical protein